MNLITAGASTQSRATRPGKPVSIAWASGATEYTADMRSILSWPMGQHGSLLGYPSLFNPYTAELVSKLTGLMNRGVVSLGSYAPDVEEKLASVLVGIYQPYSDNPLSVRFFSNGTDSTQAAVALARFVTGRDLIISIGYHGGSSPVFAFKPQNGGVIRENSSYRYDIDFWDYLDWRKWWDSWSSIASIIVEIPPVRDIDGPDLANVLRVINSDCHSHGIKLIVDEIVTGFRYGLAGATGHYKRVAPDFVCLGKALSTYGKVSAVIGSKLDMLPLRDKVFASFTYNDHPLGFHDALETIKTYQSIPNLYDHINTIGRSLRDGLNQIFKHRGFEAECYGHPSRTTIESNMKLEIYWQFLSRLVDEHNILIHRPQFATMAHTVEHVSRTLEAVNKVLSKMEYGWQ